MNNLSLNCTLVLETSENKFFMAAKLKEARSGSNPFPGKILVAARPGQKTRLLADHGPLLQDVEVLEVQSLRHDLLPVLMTPFLAYSPSAAAYTPPPLKDLEKLTTSTPFLRPWLPLVNIGENEWARLVYAAHGWVAHKDLLNPPLGQEGTLTLRDWERVTRTQQVLVPYLSAPAGPGAEGRKEKLDGSPKLTSRSKVMALVPHYQCEPWLEQCLDSLARQTRPLDAIVVLDDGSPKPPVEIVKKFPQVTLLHSDQNVGPYRLAQSAIELFPFDAFFIQDADDWSSSDRLELQLREAENTGAEWVGTQELTYFDDSLHAVRFPLVVNPALKTAIRNSFCHPSGLITRDLVLRLGGFASGLRFSGDFEFLSRAVWAGKVVNLDRYAYFRRIRQNSLITSEGTGLASSARQKVDFQILKRIAENLIRSSQGQPPLLEPLLKAGPVSLNHLAGPHLLA